jgi:hypothetical protein
LHGDEGNAMSQQGNFTAHDAACPPTREIDVAPVFAGRVQTVLSGMMMVRPLMLTVPPLKGSVLLLRVAGATTMPTAVKPTSLPAVT